ncbi:MAG: LysR family transcriptional regulator [Clostridium sp.]|nr:LysR family transcriptional regulator [Clostridium sp.]
MEIKKLKYFVTIVEEGNISAASKKLHVSQPPLSNQMKLLEEELGMKLMERGARNITLTEAGKLLYKRAKDIIELTESTKKELENIEHGLAGTFALGTNSSSGAMILKNKIMKFNKEYPKVKFEIHERNTYELLELLNSGVIEAAIVRTPFNMDRIEGYFFEEEPLVAVMKSEFEWSKDNEISLKELEGSKVIIYRRLKNIILECCSKKDIKLDIFCENDDARTTIMWANAGLGIGIIPKSALHFIKGDELIYKAIKEKELYTQLGAIWNRERYLSTIAKSFLEICKEK